MQREDDPEFWQSVTGALEDNEMPAQAAIREVWEETGIDIQEHQYALVDCQITNEYVIRPQWRYRYPPDVKLNKEHVFIVQVEPIHSIKLSEHLDYLWLNKAQAMSKAWSDSNKEAIRLFVE
jgi:dATP pyrophosphohydrolase